MALSLFGIILIIVGLLMRLITPPTPGAERTRGARRLAGAGIMALGVLMFLGSGIVLIDVGEVGVQHFLGRVKPTPLHQGVHLINPLASVEKMSIREQSYPRNSTAEHMEAQTSEQLNVALEVSLLYRIDPEKAPALFQRIGSEEQIESRIVLNAVRNGVRDAIATKSINQVFSPDRRELADAMEQAIQTKAGDRIEVIEVFVREIQAPARVRDAIEAKLQREQQVAAERFQTEIIQERARQKIEEAKGIAQAQTIINRDLTDRYLMLRYIEALEKLPQGSLVIAPTQGGVPVLVNLRGGARSE